MPASSIASMLALVLAQGVPDYVQCERSLQPARFPAEAARIDALAATTDGSAAMHFGRGCVAMRGEKWDDAVDAFQRAVKSAPSSSAHHLWLGRAYAEQALRANKLRQASLAGKIRDSFARAVQLDAENLDARVALAEFYTQAPGIMGGSEDKAKEQVREIKSRNPYRGGIAAHTLALRKGRRAEAEQEMLALLSSHPDSLVPYFTLINNYIQAKRFADAKGVVARLARLPHGAALAEYTTGRIAAESGEELEAGRAALERYLRHTPVTNEPSHAYTHYRLGMIHARRGDREAARAAWETAVRMDSTLTAARDSLKNGR